MVSFYTTSIAEMERLTFMCFGRQTKQIMVAKFQTLICLFAKPESSPNSSKRLLPFISTLSPNMLWENTA
jgi:hypothetical protein